MKGTPSLTIKRRNDASCVMINLQDMSGVARETCQVRNNYLLEVVLTRTSNLGANTINNTAIIQI